MARLWKVVSIAVLVVAWWVIVRRPEAPAAKPAPPPVPAAKPAPVVAPAPVAIAPVVDAGVVVAAVPVDAAPVQTVSDRVWSAKMMVSPDGKQIFLPVSHSDGARGSANLEYTVMNRAGKTIKHLMVQAIGELDTMNPSPAETAKIARREKAAAAMLDELVAAGFTSAPLVDITYKEEPNSDSRSHAELVRAGEHAPALTIDLIGTGGFTIKPPDHAPITRRDPAWANEPTRAEQRAMDKAAEAGTIHCFNPGFLRGATVDLSHRLALVEIGYRGNDSCWEGDDARVLVAW